MEQEKGKGEGEGRKGAPPSLVQFGPVHGEGCDHPLRPFSPSPFPSPIPTRKGGVLLPVGVGLPPWRALLLGWPSPPLILYIRGQGAPLDTTIDQ